MNTLMVNDPFTNMFREIEAIMDFDFNKESRGLKRIISKPHNLLTRKDEKGNPIAYEMQLVYTPFKKSDVKVEVLDNVLSVRCGSENKIKDNDMDYCGISHQSYEFSLPLSESINTKLISAKAEDGILYINLPMKVVEEKKPEILQINVQ